MSLFLQTSWAKGTPKTQGWGCRSAELRSAINKSSSIFVDVSWCLFLGRGAVYVENRGVKLPCSRFTAWRWTKRNGRWAAPSFCSSCHMSHETICFFDMSLAEEPVQRIDECILYTVLYIRLVRSTPYTERAGCTPQIWGMAGGRGPQRPAALRRPAGVCRHLAAPQKFLPFLPTRFFYFCPSNFKLQPQDIIIPTIRSRPPLPFLLPLLPATASPLHPAIVYDYLAHSTRHRTYVFSPRHPTCLVLPHVLAFNILADCA